MRTLPLLGADLVKQIEAAWRRPQPDWARQRLLVVRLIAQHEHTVAEIMKIAGVSRQTVFSYRDKLVAGGVEALLKRGWGGARTPVVHGAVLREFLAKLESGAFRQARDAQRWIKKRTRKTLTESGVRKVMRRVGGRLKVPRKSHVKKDPQAAAEFRQGLAERLAEVIGGDVDQPVRIWVLDEHRYGLLPIIGRIWARRGVRVHAPYKTTYQWGYLHEALEVDGRHAVELLFTPGINQDIHAVFLEQIAQSDPDALHVVIMDQAGFHLRPNDSRLPAKVRVLSLPPYCPELNPAEWFGRVVKAPTINRLYKGLRQLEDHLIATARRWSHPDKVGSLVHSWMRVQLNATAPA
jgi:transposase